MLKFFILILKIQGGMWGNKIVKWVDVVQNKLNDKNKKNLKMHLKGLLSCQGTSEYTVSLFVFLCHCMHNCV